MACGYHSKYQRCYSCWEMQPKPVPSKGTAKGKKPDSDIDSSPLPLAVLKELLGKDKDHINLPLLVAFTKNFAYDILGVKQTNVKKPVDVNVEESKEGISPQAVSVDEPLCSTDLQEQFRTIVVKYFASVKNHIIKSHKVRFLQKSSNNSTFANKIVEIKKHM